MFHRHHHADVTAVAPPRSRGVRLLETDEDLRAAVERARAFERRTAEQSGRQALNYARYLRLRSDELADVVPIDSEAASA
jgi:acyl-CoA reductase-like NAD-dependent aldehyde dehydrogenase